MARPSKLPTWATSGSAKVVEPTDNKKAIGLVNLEKPAAGILNWLLKRINDWLAYLDDTSGGGLFGDGSDGAAAFDGVHTVAGCSGTGPYTLTRDVYYTNATFSANVTLHKAGFRFSCNGTLDCSAANVVIDCDGGDGAAGVSGGTAGTRPGASGILGADAAGAGSAGTGGVASTAKSLAVALGAAGGAGGTGTSGTPAGSSAVVAPTAVQGGLRNAVSLLLGILFGASGVVPVQGGAGGTGGTGSGGGTTGGGGGGGGGVVWIHARIVRFSASTLLRAKGGNGGLGQISAGGGGGGGGGFVLLRYREVYSGSTSPSSCISVAGGTGGNGNNGGGGAGGANGSTGSSLVQAI